MPIKLANLRWHGSTSVFHLMCGEIYQINGRKIFTMGQVMKIQMAKFSDEDMLNVNEYIETLK